MINGSLRVIRVIGQLTFVSLVAANGTGMANSPSDTQTLDSLAKQQHHDFAPPLDARTARSLAVAQLAYQQGDFATEFRIVKRLAERGVAEAEDFYGCEYYNDEGGIPHDYKRAMAWFRRAAYQDDVWAQSRIAEMYYKGQGVQKDYTLADMWLNLAAHDSVADPKRYTFTLSQLEALDRDKLEQKLPPSVVERARILATRCRESKYKTCN